MSRRYIEMPPLSESLCHAQAVSKMWQTRKFCCLDRISTQPTSMYKRGISLFPKGMRVVYVFGDGTGCHKVGRSSDLAKRQKAIQFGNPRPLVLVACAVCVSRDCNIKTGEWELGEHVFHAPGNGRTTTLDHVGPYCSCESMSVSVEGLAHKLLRPARVMGEWFGCTASAAIEALAKAASQHGAEVVDLALDESQGK